MHPAGKLPPTLTPTGHFAGKPTLPISRSVTLIGSRKQARLQLISSTVSQNHALIVNADSGPVHPRPRHRASTRWSTASR